MPEIDLSTWPTLKEAAAILRTSVRSIWRENERGELEMQKRPRPGKKPENVVRPEDLEKLKPQPYPVRKLPPMPQSFYRIAGMMQDPPEPELTGERFDRFIASLEAIGQRALPAPAEPARPEPAIAAVALNVKLWLTIEEAAIYSGFSERKLRMNIEAGNLFAVPDGPRGKLIISRARLEEFAGCTDSDPSSA